MLQSAAVGNSVSVDGLEVKDARFTARSTGPQSLLAFSHQPPVIVGNQLVTNVILPPCIQPGLETLVQPCADLLVGLDTGMNRHK